MTIEIGKTKISKALAFDPANANRRIDVSEVINVIPNYWYLTEALGMFEPEYKTQKTALVPVFTENANVAVDRNWGERNSNVRKSKKEYLTIQIPHFPLDDAITPEDIDGIADWNQVYQGVDLETIASVRERKMNAIRRTLAYTREVARLQLITTGTIYAPNNTVVKNFYTEFGISRTEIEADFSGGANPNAVIEQIVGALQDNLHTGAIVTNFVAFCSPTYFQAIINNAQVVDTLKYQLASGKENILLSRPVATRLDARYRSFDLAGVTFFEVRGTNPVTGDPLIPAGDAYFFPLGVEGMFRTLYAPAHRLSTVNTSARQDYFFEYRNERDDIIEIMAESNFANVLAYPQEIVRSYLKA